METETGLAVEPKEKAGSQRPSAPLKIYLQELSQSLVCDDITFVYWVSKGPSTPVG